MDLRLRQGTSDDFDALLRLFDEAVAWMVARGQEGQWGREPWSERPAARTRVREMSRHAGLTVAEKRHEVVGAVVVGRRPAHVPAVQTPERYVEALISSREHAGSRIGEHLLAHAEAHALADEVPLLRVDCWAQAPTLIAWYVRRGFRPSDRFEVNGWQGQVFEKPLHG